MKKQVKSNYYYIFWGAATVAVVLGQIYVGTGYRLLHGSMKISWIRLMVSCYINQTSIMVFYETELSTTKLLSY